MSLPDYVIKEESLCHKMRKEEVERVPLFLVLVFVKEQTKLFDWIEKQGIYTVQPVIQGLQRKHEAYESLKSAVVSLFQLELKPASYCEHDHTLTLRTFGDRS